jgi:multicomponent Na+:H+ antiporter subunit F
VILVTNFGFVMLGLAAAMTLVRLFRGPSLADRMVALDTLLFIGAASVGAYIARTGSTAFVPVLVGIALVAFVGTVVVARSIEQDGPA